MAITPDRIVRKFTVDDICTMFDLDDEERALLQRHQEERRRLDAELADYLVEVAIHIDYVRAPTGPDGKLEPVEPQRRIMFGGVQLPPIQFTNDNSPGGRLAPDAPGVLSQEVVDAINRRPDPLTPPPEHTEAAWKHDGYKSPLDKDAAEAAQAYPYPGRWHNMPMPENPVFVEGSLKRVEDYARGRVEGDDIEALERSVTDFFAGEGLTVAFAEDDDGLGEG